MVDTGQFLERPAVIACGALALDGLYHRGRRAPALLVCAPYGPGGGMDTPVAAELAWACAQAGNPSLRFQHRGFGGSTGSRDPARRVEDALAALAHLAESGGVPRVAVAGIGNGCATAVEVARAITRVSALVLVGPEEVPTLDGVSARTLVLEPEHGAVTTGEISGARREVIAGADPLFLSGLPALGRAAVRFLGAGE